MAEDPETWNEALRRQSLYSYEYERRFISTLSIASAGAFAFVLTFSQSFSDPDDFLYEMRISLWFFLLAFVASGILPFLQARRYSLMRDSTYSTAQAKLLKIGRLNQREWNIIPAETRISLYEEWSDQEFKKSNKYRNLYYFSMLLACVSLLIGLGWPVLLLTLRGYI